MTINNKLVFGYLFLWITLLGCLSLNANNGQLAERQIQNFRLKNVNRKMVSLSDYKDAKGFIIIFTCNHCPFAKLYNQRIIDLQNKYAKIGFPVIAINSVSPLMFEEETPQQMAKLSKSLKYNFPYLLDDKQSVAKMFGADKTPHCFVIQKEAKGYLIKYNGAIDDNGNEPDKVTAKYVEDCIQSLMANKPIKVKETKSIGCAIKLVSQSK